MFCKICLPLMIAFLLLPRFSTCSSAAEASFRLQMQWVEDEFEPESRSRDRGLQMDVSLVSNGQVREIFSWTNRRQRRARLQEGELGDDVDGRLPGRWKVVNETTLVRLSAERSHTLAIWLRTDGSRSCSISLEWRLKPGFKAYERFARRRDQQIRFMQPRVRLATCEAL
jgi:hypothetical protein